MLEKTKSLKDKIVAFNKTAKTNLDLKLFLLSLFDNHKDWENTVIEAFDTSSNFSTRLGEVIAMGYRIGAKIKVTVRGFKTEHTITGYVWGTDDICFITDGSTSKGFAFKNVSLK